MGLKTLRLSAATEYALLPRAVVALHRERPALYYCPVPEPAGRVTIYLTVLYRDCWSTALAASVEPVGAQGAAGASSRGGMNA